MRENEKAAARHIEVLKNSKKEKLENGAALIQVWTGFIYEGPDIVKKVCQSLK